jgi:hypothetical protein
VFLQHGFAAQCITSESQLDSYPTTDANDSKAEQDFGLPKGTAVPVGSPVSDKSDNVSSFPMSWTTHLTFDNSRVSRSMPCQPWAGAILEESEDMGLKFEKVGLVVNGEMMSPTHPQLLPEEDGEALNARAPDNEDISLSLHVQRSHGRKSPTVHR